jgi:hypothetical protein
MALARERATFRVRGLGLGCVRHEWRLARNHQSRARRRQSRVSVSPGEWCKAADVVSGGPRSGRTLRGERVSDSVS